MEANICTDDNINPPKQTVPNDVVTAWDSAI